MYQEMTDFVNTGDGGGYFGLGLFELPDRRRTVVRLRGCGALGTARAATWYNPVERHLRLDGGDDRRRRTPTRTRAPSSALIAAIRAIAAWAPRRRRQPARRRVGVGGRARRSESHGRRRRLRLAAAPRSRPTSDLRQTAMRAQTDVRGRLGARRRRRGHRDDRTTITPMTFVDRAGLRRGDRCGQPAARSRRRRPADGGGGGDAISEVARDRFRGWAATTDLRRDGGTMRGGQGATISGGGGGWDCSTARDGADHLTGGGGRDTFRFSGQRTRRSREPPTTVRDFDTGAATCSTSI